MKRSDSFKITLAYIFGGYAETKDMVYGFYGIIPAWYRDLKYNIKRWFKILGWNILIIYYKYLA